MYRAYRQLEANPSYELDAVLLGLLAEVGDKVVAVLVHLQASEGHLGTRDVLLGFSRYSKRVSSSR